MAVPLPKEAGSSDGGVVMPGAAPDAAQRVQEAEQGWAAMVFVNRKVRCQHIICICDFTNIHVCEFTYIFDTYVKSGLDVCFPMCMCTCETVQATHFLA